LDAQELKSEALEAFDEGDLRDERTKRAACQD